MLERLHRQREARPTLDDGRCGSQITRQRLQLRPILREPAIRLDAGGRVYAPIGDLLDRSDPAVRAEVLADSPVWDLVRREAVEDLMDAPDLPNSRSKFLFTFLNVKMFLEEC